MKKRIRLTESDLRNIVREAINELNWKTYANAAKKRAWQGDPKNSVKDLDAAANKELEKLYSIPKENAYYRWISSPEIKTTKYNRISDPNTYISKQFIKFPNHEHPMFQDRYLSITDDDDEYPINDYELDLYNSVTDPIDRKSRKDLINYTQGKSKYVKGKGWLDEDINEAVYHTLRKYLR